MALTLTEVRSRSVGNMKCVTGKIGFDSSYAATPGEALLMATLGLTQMFYFHAHDVGGYSFEHNYSLTAGKMAAFMGGGLGAHTHDILIKGSASAGIDEPIGVEGTDTLAKDAATDRTIAGATSATKGGVVANAAGAGAALADASGADLSLLTTRFIAFGI